ncbi:winged helix-turn-helix domain-containing protein [Candidatus Oleimmundimicrobium sp.]|uniref:winged helix-turn-helix domain-containing protein n=1 Tax=Candidatus Oleimmundimicrobium sp. TaxID=3060597 RepID=UPI002716BE44|nr:winged helix-turn-helix domain-containing protein [Candidatus Oleimmundimicrobium sp.]MDO8885375.1 winged helix-turn-helix domain-containing protein [Candidatus Oleimmundimicrobium sp.]
MNVAEELLGSKVRAKLLEVIFLNPETHYYGRLLQKITGLDHKAIWRELNILEKTGVIKSENDGRLKRYSVVSFHGSEDLANFILKSSGKLRTTKKRLQSGAKVKTNKTQGELPIKSPKKIKQLTFELNKV